MGPNAWLGLLGGLGLVTCFAGYRVFTLALALLGAWVGGFLGFTVGGLMGSELTTGIGTVIGALLLALLAGVAYRACVALLGAVLFGAIAAILLVPLGPIAQLIGGCAAAAVGAGAALFLQRTVITLATAVQGALATVLAGVVLADHGSLGEYQYRFSLIVSGAESPAAVLGGPWLTILWGALAVAGTVVQIRRGRPAAPPGKGSSKTTPRPS